MRWAVKIYDDPESPLDLMRNVMRLPPSVGDAVIGHIQLMSRSGNPITEFANYTCLLVSAIHFGAIVTVLQVVYEDEGLYIFGIPFRCSSPGDAEKNLFIEGLWVLETP